MFLLAQGAEQSGLRSKAWEAYQTIVALEPTNVTGWLGCARHAPTIEEAIRCLDRAIELAPGLDEVHAARESCRQELARSRAQVPQ